MLIGIEGMDGCGKGTQVKMLAEALALDPAATVKVYGFPNRQTLSGALIDQFLKGTMRVDALVNPGACHPDSPGTPHDAATSVWRPTNNATSVALQCAMIVNRLEFVPQILAHSREGHTVIFDRYTDSGIVYGTADGISSVWLTQAQLALPRLDLHILLDIDVETSYQRRPERQEMYEANRERMRTVCDGYRAWWDLNHTLAVEQRMVSRWLMIDGRREPAEVHQDILKAVRNS
jgi:thymidylate kinase